MQDLVPRQLGSSALNSLDPRISVPHYQRDSLQRSIVHLGVGGFHRAHLAAYIDEVCTGGSREWSIVGSGLLPGDRRMAEALRAQDHLYSLVVKGADEVSVSVPGSIVDYILAVDDAEGLTKCLADPDTRIASLTVTEGGYPIDDDTGEYDPQSSVAGPGSAFAILADALGRRRDLGTAPITVLSCD